MAPMPAKRRRTGRKRLRSAEAGFVRGDDSDEAAELTHICQGCGKRCVSARSLNAHCGNCPCLRRPTIDETAPVSSWTTETEDQPLEYEDIDHQPDCNPELLRMFTDWRVHNMTDVDVQRVKEGIGTVLGVFKKKLRATFAHHEFPSLEEVFEHADNLLEGLRTSKVERTKAKRHYKPVPYHVRVLGSTRVVKPTPHGSQEVSLDDVVVENLVEDCLEQLICTPELAIDFVSDKRSADNNIIADVHDGQLFRRHPLFSRHPTSVAWGLYGDDFEVHNPIGPSAGVRKVSLHYAVCYNLPKPTRFSINNLVMVSACYTKDVKKYGCRQVISGSGGDTSWGGSMRRFADGIVLPKINQLANLPIGEAHFGAQLNFFADSPFLAFYLARKESLSATTERICVKCNCTSANKAKWFSHSEEGCQWEPLTTEILEQQREQIRAAQSGRATWFQKVSKQTGLNADEDAFMGIPWWDSTQAAFYDWFHGEAEGPIKDHVYLFLHHGVQMGYFTPARLNTLVIAVS